MKALELPLLRVITNPLFTLFIGWKSTQTILKKIVNKLSKVETNLCTKTGNKRNINT